MLYVDHKGQIFRQGPAFFGARDDVRIEDGEVLVNGRIVEIDAVESAWIPEYSPLWDPEAMVWQKSVEGEYRGLKTQVTFYIHKYLAERETQPVRGLMENTAVGGRLEDVANGVATTLYYLPESGTMTPSGVEERKVTVNMKFNPDDGSFDMVDWEPWGFDSPSTIESFDPSHVNVVFDDGDTSDGSGLGFNHRPPCFCPPFAWGINPKDRSLYIFTAQEIEPDYIHSVSTIWYLYVAMYEMLIATPYESGELVRYEVPEWSLKHVELFKSFYGVREGQDWRKRNNLDVPVLSVNW